MKLSFVIPAYNESETIGKCLEAIVREVKNNNYETEIIVVNNASADDTAEVARTYENVKVVDEPKKGIVITRQKGFFESQGELIANIDADVMLTPGWLKRVINEFSRNPNLVCLSGPFTYYDLSWWPRLLTKAFYGIGYLIYLVSRFVLRIGSMAQGGNFVVKKSALQKIGGYNTAIDFYGEDTDTARRLSKVGDVKFTFGLPVYASGRRLAAEGVFRTGFAYALNYFWVSFLNRPFTKTSKDIRITKQ